MEETEASSGVGSVLAALPPKVYLSTSLCRGQTQCFRGRQRGPGVGGELVSKPMKLHHPLPPGLSTCHQDSPVRKLADPARSPSSWGIWPGPLSSLAPPCFQSLSVSMSFSLSLPVSLSHCLSQKNCAHPAALGVALRPHLPPLLCSELPDHGSWLTSLLAPRHLAQETHRHLLPSSINEGLSP